MSFIEPEPGSSSSRSSQAYQTEPSSPHRFESSGQEGGHVDYMDMEKRSTELSDGMGDPFVTSLISYHQPDQDYKPVRVTRNALQHIKASEIIVVDFGRPLPAKYYRNLMPDLQIVVCPSCFKVANLRHQTQLLTNISFSSSIQINMSCELSSRVAVHSVGSSTNGLTIERIGTYRICHISSIECQLVFRCTFLSILYFQCHFVHCGR